MIGTAEAGTYVPSLAQRSVLSNLPTFSGPIASLRGSVFGLPVLGLLGAVGLLIVAEHLRRRRGR